jgi:hypothetical protein
MPVEVHISNDGHVVNMAYVDPWSIRDLLETYPQQKEWVEQGQDDMSILVDLRRTAHVPPGVLRVRESPLMKTPRVKRIAAVGGPEYARVLGDAVLRLIRFKGARFFKNMDEAMAYLRTSND